MVKRFLLSTLALLVVGSSLIFAAQTPTYPSQQSKTTTSASTSKKKSVKKHAKKHHAKKHMKHQKHS
ncbi:MAG TPA: hypothetical protein VGL91_00115 [Acidobacteriota bacterium]|jgi:hypothetical protein